MKQKRPRQSVDPMISHTMPMGSLSYSDKKSPANTATPRTTVIDFQPQDRSRQVLPQPMPRPETNNQTTPEPPKKGRKRQNKQRSNRPRRTLRRVLLILLVLLVLAGGWLGWKFYHNISKITGDSNPFHLFSSSPLEKTDGRTNILLAGYSVDNPGHSGASLTDSIMVISVNQDTNEAALISIPRDLWVNIPDNGYEKINAAFPYGSEGQTDAAATANGMNLLSGIVSDVVGLDIHYYALINYTAFRDAVDAVGGIRVDLTSDDNPYGLYDPYTNLDLPNGVVDLDGETALNLARSRGDGPGAYGFPRSDFNRTEHQRLMLVALKDKATSSGVVSNPLKVAELADAGGNNVTTSFGSGEIQTLAQLLMKIDTTAIASTGLNNLNDKNLLKSYVASGGRSALAPAAGVDEYSDIHAEIQLFLNPPPEPDFSQDPPATTP